MSQSLKTKTNEELIKLIMDAATELEWRRQANKAAGNDGPSTQDETDEGGDHPPVVHFP